MKAQTFVSLNSRLESNEEKEEEEEEGVDARVLTSCPLSIFQIFTRLSCDPLTMRVPSGEKATMITDLVCPVSVHTCQPNLSSVSCPNHSCKKIRKTPPPSHHHPEKRTHSRMLTSAPVSVFKI